MTVHSRGGLQGRELGHSPHKKSLLIYFPPNWKVHAHTWLNHHASTGDGPPPHTGETWAQLCCTVLGQPGRKNTRMHCTPCNGFCRCAGPDSSVLNMALIIEKSFIKFVILLFFSSPSLSLSVWSWWPQNALSLFLGLPQPFLVPYHPPPFPSIPSFSSSITCRPVGVCKQGVHAQHASGKRFLPLNRIFWL